MKVEDLKVVATQDEILARIEAIAGSDLFGEYRPALIGYLDYEHVKPFLKDGVTEAEWEMHGDKELQADVTRYLEWWGQKVEDGRGISVHRGRAQIVNRLFLAGIPLWEEIGLDSDGGIDGGWYQEDAYNKVADLFEYPHVSGHKEE